MTLIGFPTQKTLLRSVQDILCLTCSHSVGELGNTWVKVTLLCSQDVLSGRVALVMKLTRVQWDVSSPDTLLIVVVGSRPTPLPRIFCVNRVPWLM